MVNSFKLHTITFESSVLNICQGSEFTSGYRNIITTVADTKCLKYFCFSHIS